MHSGTGKYDVHFNILAICLYFLEDIEKRIDEEDEEKQWMNYVPGQKWEHCAIPNLLCGYNCNVDGYIEHRGD